MFLIFGVSVYLIIGLIITNFIIQIPYSEDLPFTAKLLITILWLPLFILMLFKNGIK